MRTVGQRRGRISPGAAAVGDRAAQQGRAVKHLHRGVRFRRAGQGEDICARDLVTNGARIGRERGDARRHRRRRVDGHAQRRRGCTGVGGRIAGRRGQAVRAVRQRRRRISSRPRCRWPPTLPSRVVPSKTLTVALASAVPVSVSVASLVMWSPTVPLSVENEAMLGAAGATVSTVTFMTADGALVLPDTVSVAVKLWTPSGKGTVVKLQAPLAFAVAVPSSVVPS